MGRRRTVALAIAVAAVTSACGTQGLAFVTDDRVEIIRPADRAEVTLPLEVRWTARDLPSGTAFGVFLDQSPQPPGETVAWFARDDDACRADDGCPDEEYLADRGVYTTTERSFTVELLPRTVPEEQQRREFHELTVALLGDDGRRIGESSWFVEFQVKREED